MKRAIMLSLLLVVLVVGCEGVSVKGAEDYVASPKVAAAIDAGTKVVDAVAPFIPAPWGTIVIGASGLILGLLRAAQNRSNARRVIASVDHLIEPTKEQAVEITFEQGAGGNRLVDEAQGKSLKLPF